MARNIEIKAAVVDRAELIARVEALAEVDSVEFGQDDTFFYCGHGRLKLRDFGDGSGELIAYRRPDQTGPSLASYERSPTASPDTLGEVLAAALGVLARVKKTRRLYRFGRTRIHIDRVERLGDFMELEVVLDDNEPIASARTEAESLMIELGIDRADLCATAYVDMLLDKIDVG